MKRSPKSILKNYWGYDSFLPVQEQIIDSVLAGNHTLAILPTGAGKSLCYQIPALLKQGTALVISPLVALMKEQVQDLQSRNVPAAYINSELGIEEIAVLLEECKLQKIKLLYIAPERLQNQFFIQHIRDVTISFIAVDEAHCIAEWGHDFRPSYLKISEFNQDYPKHKILALTATATQNTKTEIINKLQMSNAVVFNQSVSRSNLAYQVRKTETIQTDLLLETQNNEPTIVFTRTRKETFFLSNLLNNNHIQSDFYHANLDTEVKTQKLQNWLQSNQLTMVATNAFGMGINKNNLRKVMHLHVPASIEAYVQEVGRAGRDNLPAKGVLLYNQSSIDLAQQLFKDQLAVKHEFFSIVKSLWDFNQIAEGELREGSTHFFLLNFANKIDIHKRKVQSVLSHLNAKEVISIKQQANTSNIKLLFSPNQLQYLKGKQSKVADVLCRLYPGIFNDYIAINEFEIAKQLTWSKELVKNTLTKMSKKRMIVYQNKQYNQIRFLQHRENRRLNQYYQSYQTIQNRNWQKLQDMIFYVTQNQYCRQMLIQRYFGEKTNQKCGVCDVCTAQSINNNTIGLQKKILDFIAESTKNTLQIQVAFSQHSSNNIKHALQNLINQEQIEQLGLHQFKIKKPN